MAEFTAITTQEEFDSRIKERIQRAEARVREGYTGWTSPEELEKIKAAQAADAEKLTTATQQLAAKDSEIKTLKTEAAKAKAAAAHKLPAEAAEFLRGDDAEAIEASAAKLAKLYGAGAQQSYTRTTEETRADADEPYREMLNSLKK